MGNPSESSRTISSRIPGAVIEHGDTGGNKAQRDGTITRVLLGKGGLRTVGVETVTVLP